MSKQLTPQERERAAQLVVLFSELIHAWITHNFAEATQAQRDLLNSGIEIRFRRRTGSEVRS